MIPGFLFFVFVCDSPHKFCRTQTIALKSPSQGNPHGSTVLTACCDKLLHLRHFQSHNAPCCRGEILQISFMITVWVCPLFAHISGLNCSLTNGEMNSISISHVSICKLDKHTWYVMVSKPLQNRQAGHWSWLYNGRFFLWRLKHQKYIFENFNSNVSYLKTWLGYSR